MMKTSAPPDDMGISHTTQEVCHQILQRLPDRVCLLDTRNRIKVCNTAFAESRGRSAEALEGVSFADGLDASAVGRIEADITQVRATGLPVILELDRGGQYEEHRFFALREQDGGIQRVAWVSRDITDRRVLEDALIRNTRKLETLLANLPGMAYRCRNEAGWPMDFASEGAHELTGYPSGDFSMQNPFLYAELIQPADRERVWQTVQRGVRRKEPFTMEYRIVDASGREKWVWEKGRLTGGGEAGESILEGFILDISERKQLEAMRAEAAANELALEKAHKAESLARMAGAVAHHFNNKMQVVIGCLEMAEAEIKEVFTDHSEAGAEIHAAAGAALQAASISRNMLTILGNTLAEKTRIDLGECLREAAGKPLPDAARVCAKWPKDPVWVMANPGEMQEVLGYFLINAAEAHPGGRIDLRVRHSAVPPAPGAFIRPENWRAEGDRWAVLEVADQGPGVPHAIRDQIFDPFFTTKFTGRGLGLAMCLGIVRKMSGVVEVAESDTGGAVFRVWLPCDTPDAVVRSDP